MAENKRPKQGGDAAAVLYPGMAGATGAVGNDAGPDMIAMMQQALLDSTKRKNKNGKNAQLSRKDEAALRNSRLDLTNQMARDLLS